jgi:hypothetical protein
VSRIDKPYRTAGRRSSVPARRFLAFGPLAGLAFSRWSRMWGLFVEIDEPRREFEARGTSIGPNNLFIAAIA